MGKYLLHGMVCGSSTYLPQCRVAQIAKREQRLSAFQLPVLPTVLSYPQSAREFECLKRGVAPILRGRIRSYAGIFLGVIEPPLPDQ